VRDYQKAPPILCSPPDLRQAILHLIDNAREAMQEGGTLKIEVHSMDDKAVRLNVKDSGRGIAKEHVDRVFDPFFTTKAEWQRKGLGLSVTHKIVEEHGGRIRVQSSLGVGTTMEVVLPAVLKATLLA
jgi:signal transduction histidine kinase